ncbi:UNVERIFIED_CONTAM: Wall-associated receptor kinase [Sesamum radiatum]|uniref:Wall-associated receptor kinase n=1 Tax=Sesamum radiatum TaxID=300843 RepID=A0AAW2PX29_SESRA
MQIFSMHGQGTVGDLNLENLHMSQLTEESGVYSVGIILVELLMTGQKTLCFSRPEEARSLAVYFLNFVRKNWLMNVVEERIAHEGNPSTSKR